MCTNLCAIPRPCSTWQRTEARRPRDIGTERQKDMETSFQCIHPQPAVPTRFNSILEAPNSSNNTIIRHQRATPTQASWCPAALARRITQLTNWTHLLSIVLVLTVVYVDIQVFLNVPPTSFCSC